VKRHRILIDTGPIVAILSQSDQHHERCVAELGSLRPPLFTCWPVLTEAQWLLRHDAKGIDGLFRAFSTKLLALLPLDDAALPFLQAFLAQYRRMKPDLADAALMYLAQREGIQTIFTLDRRDFSVYRYGRNRRLKVIPSAED
jgi:predicted nucleic acid-binding protein